MRSRHCLRGPRLGGGGPAARGVRALICLGLALSTGACSGSGGGSEEEDDEGEAGDDTGADELIGPSTLLLVDPSPSMQEEQEAVLLGLEALVEATGARGRVGIATVSVEEHEGALLGEVVDLAEAGALEALQAQLACSGACWTGGLPSDPDHACGDGLGSGVTEEWLDCTCGVDQWSEGCVSGNEEPLEAALLATCRANEEEPEACAYTQSPWTESWLGSNAGLLRGGVLHLVVVSDEGDNSRRLAAGHDDPTLYAEALLEAAPAEVLWHYLGPDADLVCNSGSATTWGVARLDTLVSASGGVRGELSVEGGDGSCAPGDVDAFFRAVGQSGPGGG